MSLVPFVGDKELSRITVDEFFDLIGRDVKAAPI